MRQIATQILLAALIIGCTTEETWRGLVVSPEKRCAPYKKSDYPHSQSVEMVLHGLYGGKFFSPYENKVYKSRFETDIEHMVATVEAHDSGLCKASRAVREEFSRDIDNLTLAGARVNRIKKSGKDAGEWMPDHNRCWYAHKVFTVKSKYKLSVDKKELAVLKSALYSCKSFLMEMK